MKLWIRSQNKSILVKVTDVGCILTNKIYKIVTYGGNYTTPNYCVLGKYNSKKRALEVLDEIQHILVDYKQMSRVVYCMPEN